MSRPRTLSRVSGTRRIRFWSFFNCRDDTTRIRRTGDTLRNFACCLGAAPRATLPRRPRCPTPPITDFLKPHLRTCPERLFSHGWCTYWERDWLSLRSAKKGEICWHDTIHCVLLFLTLSCALSSSTSKKLPPCILPPPPLGMHRYELGLCSLGDPL